MLELADRHDLGSCVERREGSSPSAPTTKHFIIRKEKQIEHRYKTNGRPPS